MNLNGETIIAAPPETVWRALNDPDVLRRAIPGCESLEKISDTEMKATASLKIGPMQTRFNGAVVLSDINAPHGYTITGSGSGGVAGNAKGAAKVRLEPHEGGTKLIYDVEAQVAGKLAQLGSRLIDATAKMLAGQFFDRFGAIVAPPVAESATGGTGADGSTGLGNGPRAGLAVHRPSAGGMPSWVWLAAVAVIGLASIWWLR